MKSIHFTTESELNTILDASDAAYKVFSRLSVDKRASFLDEIAIQMTLRKTEIIETASFETNLPLDRIDNEFQRTVYQLRSYAENCRKGLWLDVRIDTKDSEGQTTPNDLRKTYLGLGPVAVFGASNFPLAYSTAGGDTACAFAAGCTVVVKAHNGHLQTGLLVSEAIERAVDKCGLPKGVYAQVTGKGNEIGEQLVTHSKIKAVGFTGSYTGGMALHRLAINRKEPIPVFAEMGSVNPVYLFHEYLAKHVDLVVDWFAQSITASMGQFCTNPGILVGIKSKCLDEFIDKLAGKINAVKPELMLHQGIADAFKSKRDTLLKASGVNLVTNNIEMVDPLQGIPSLAIVEAHHFIENKVLREEVFGPLSLMVICSNYKELALVANVMDGQLTATIIAEEDELSHYSDIVDAITDKCGRLIYNGVPTGVQVSLAQNHGGPFPATTDSRFTAVGADGIRRFARPITYQNYPDALLPLELQNDNPLNILRTINNRVTMESI